MTSRKRAPVWKDFLYWAATASAVMLGYAFKDQLGITPGVWILFVGMMIYFQYTQNNSNERIGLEFLPTLDQIVETNNAEPMTPKHNRPQPLPVSGWGINDRVRLFFGHFEAFADVANDCLRDTPWRLQEEADTDVATLGDDGPIVGRQYRLFHGEKWVGKITLSDGFQYSLESPVVNTTILIFYPRRFSPSDISELASWLVSLNCSASLDEQQLGYRALQKAMIDSIWQIGPEVITNMDLEVRFNGSAQRYLLRANLRPTHS